MDDVPLKEADLESSGEAARLPWVLKKLLPGESLAQSPPSVDPSGEWALMSVSENYDRWYVLAFVSERVEGVPLFDYERGKVARGERC